MFDKAEAAERLAALVREHVHADTQPPHDRVPVMPASPIISGHHNSVTINVTICTHGGENHGS